MAALLVSLAVMSVLMSAVLPAWRHQAQREKEAELVFRGEQYVRAIRLWEMKMGPGSRPPNFDMLVQQKFLRKKYKDPMTEDGEFQPLFVGANCRARRSWRRTRPGTGPGGRGPGTGPGGIGSGGPGGIGSSGPGAGGRSECPRSRNLSSLPVSVARWAAAFLAWSARARRPRSASTRAQYALQRVDVRLRRRGVGARRAGQPDAGRPRAADPLPGGRGMPGGRGPGRPRAPAGWPWHRPGRAGSGGVDPATALQAARGRLDSTRLRWHDVLTGDSTSAAPPGANRSHQR